MNWRPNGTRLSVNCQLVWFNTRWSFFKKFRPKIKTAKNCSSLIIIYMTCTSMNEWSSGKMMGVNYLLVWLKSRRSLLKWKVLPYNKDKKSSKLIICNTSANLNRWSSGESTGSNLAEVFWNEKFCLTIKKKKIVKVNNLQHKHEHDKWSGGESTGVHCQLSGSNLGEVFWNNFDLK